MSSSGALAHHGAMEAEDQEMTRLCLGVGSGGNEVCAPPATDVNGTTVAWRTGRQLALANCARKKQSFSLEQEALLESAFRRHAILPNGVKQDLARELHLPPHTVEVWFQNRRARSKLKQTEHELELLRQHCQRLTAENTQLRQEIAAAYNAFTACPAAVPPPSTAMAAGPSSSSGAGAGKLIIQLD